MKKIIKFVTSTLLFTFMIFPFTTEQLSTNQENKYIYENQLKNTSGVNNSINDTDAHLDTQLSIQTIDIPTVTKSPIKNLIIQTAEIGNIANENLNEIKDTMSKIQLEKDTYIAKEYVEYATEIVKKYPNLKLSLVIAVIECESSGRPNVVSKAGAIGLMQIIPKWSQDKMKNLGVSSLYDPYGNILVGCDILSEHLEKYNGDIYASLMKYNGTKNPEIKSKAGQYSDYSIKVVERAKELAPIYD